MKPYTTDEGLRGWLPEPHDLRPWGVRWPSWTKIAWWFLIGLLLGFWGGTLLAADEISLVVYPTQLIHTQDPSYVRASWWIAAHEDNRRWSLAWASTEGLSGSTEGAVDARHYDRIVEVSVGTYAFEACVYRSTRARFCAHASAEVH